MSANKSSHIFLLVMLFVQLHESRRSEILKSSLTVYQNKLISDALFSLKTQKKRECMTKTLLWVVKILANTVFKAFISLTGD